MSEESNLKQPANNEKKKRESLKTFLKNVGKYLTGIF